MKLEFRNKQGQYLFSINNDIVVTCINEFDKNSSFTKRQKELTSGKIFTVFECTESVTLNFLKGNITCIFSEGDYIKVII